MLPKKYQFLEKESGPRMIKEALKLYGTLELYGSANSPTILSWANELGKNINDVYKADSIPWCGLFIGIVAKRSDKEVVKSPLWALSWATFGKRVDIPMLGDVLVFTRSGGGHVGLYVGEDNTAYHLLGGNQSDAVNIIRINKNRLYTARRPEWKIAQPCNVRVIKLGASGPISDNEQ